MGQVGRERWASFLASNRYASPFQSPDFFDFLNAFPSTQTAKVFAVERESRLTALCVVTLQKERGVKGYFSRRAIVYGGPLLSGDGPSDLDSLLQAMESRLRRQAIYLEIRNFHDYQLFFPVYLKKQWVYLPYLNSHLPLAGRTLEEVLAGMKYNRRREINLSLKEGAIGQCAQAEEEVREVYRLLLSLYRERVKLPLPGFDFFYNLFLSRLGKVFVVKHEGRAIGGAFCLFLQGHGIYTFYYCGLRRYHPKIFPTHLAVLAAIEYGLQNGARYLDFMGLGLDGVEYGVQKYKKEFGGEVMEQGRFVKVLNPLLYQFGKLGLSIMQKVK